MIPISEFVTQIRTNLDLDPDALINPYDGYLDLAKCERVGVAVLKENQHIPAADPLLDTFLQLRRCIRLHHPDYLHVGVNEVLKAYLLLLGHRNQEFLTRKVWHNTEGLLHYALGISYPFTTDFFTYLSSCIEPSLIFTLDESYHKATEVILQHLMSMGRMAVRAGLHTSKLQHTLRILELKCRDHSLTELLGITEEIRQNMEI